MMGPPVRASGVRAVRSSLLVVVVGLLLMVSFGLAQPLPDEAPLPAEVEAVLARGVEAAERGMASPAAPHPDHADWRLVLEAGREAVELLDHAVTRRFMARAYALSGWSSRALAAFDELLRFGHPLGAEDERLVPEITSLELYRQAAADMAFARYQAGDAAGAERVYARWLELEPDAPEPVRWLGRLTLEQGDPEAALAYWERLLELLPDDEAAIYGLREAQREVRVGPAAAAAFRDGIAAYEVGRLEDAFDGFAAALEANPAYVDAAWWAGRSALELGRPEVAVGYWSLVLDERPDDPGATYFLRLAEDQIRYGVQAGRAFFDGMAAYESGDLEAALDALEAAVAANAGYTTAWVWVARVRQELGRYEAAVEGWERVLELDPGDARARYFKTLARQQQGVRPEAGEVFAQAVAAYERADFVTAEALFREVVAIDPTSATAWSWVGRVAFGERRYEDAAVAYARASSLNPSDEDLAFFAGEAAALAQADDDDPLTRPEPHVEPEPAPEPAPEPEPEVDPDAEPEPEVAPDVEPESDPDAEPEPIEPPEDVTDGDVTDGAAQRCPGRFV